MKQKIIIIILIFLFIILLLTYTIYHKQMINGEAIKNNKEIEKYTKDVITGTDLITVINKAIDKNEYNGVSKDSNSKYINNDTNSIKVEVKFLEKEENVSMESIYSLGIEEFIKYYSKRSFKCKELKYHNKTKNISYLKFDEVQNDY